MGGIQFAIGCLQIIRDKSQESLSAGSPVFYRLHIFLPNFTEECRGQQITKGKRAQLTYQYFLMMKSIWMIEFIPMKQVIGKKKRKKYLKAKILQANHG